MTKAEEAMLDAVVSADMSSIYEAMAGSMVWRGRELEAVPRFFAAAEALRKERQLKHKWYMDGCGIHGPSGVIAVPRAGTWEDCTRLLELLNRIDP